MIAIEMLRFAAVQIGWKANMGDAENERLNAANDSGSKGKPTLADEKAPHITRINVATFSVSVALIALAIFLTTQLITVTGKSDDVYARYKECSDADTQLMEASDYLTTQVRLFATTGYRVFMDNYFKELLETRRRDEAVAVLETQAGSEKAKDDLVAALKESNELAVVEEYSMRLVAEAEGMTDLPEAVENTKLDAHDQALSPDEKRDLAVSLVIGGSYDKMKASILKDVEKSSSSLVSALDREQLDIERETNALLIGLVVVGILLLFVVALGGFATMQLVTRPMKIHAENLAREGHLDHIGCYEIRRVVNAYNDMFDRVQEKAERFKHEAEIDALTHLLNRGSFDRIVSGREGDYALVLADIDHFKDINDQHGHEVGDEVIRAVADAIGSHFRSSDFVCRLGGDEFAVILPNTRPENRETIEAKLVEIAKALNELPDKLPRVTLSFGVAFSDGGTEDIYNAADTALYESKRGGRNRITFFES